jgi:hypothetical protein
MDRSLGILLDIQSDTNREGIRAGDTVHSADSNSSRRAHTSSMSSTTTSGYED